MAGDCITYATRVALEWDEIWHVDRRVDHWHVACYTDTRLLRAWDGATAALVRWLRAGDA